MYLRFIDLSQKHYCPGLNLIPAPVTGGTVVTGADPVHGSVPVAETGELVRALAAEFVALTTIAAVHSPQYSFPVAVQVAVFVVAPVTVTTSTPPVGPVNVTV